MATRRPSKQAKAEEALAKMAEAMGGKLDMSSLMKLREKPAGSPGANREAESVLRSLHQPHAYVMKKCKRKDCGEVFQTNYCSVGYCSDACLVAEFRDIGIHYDPYRLKRYESSMYNSASGLVYRYEPPEYIPSEILNNLEKVFTDFLADIARLREHSTQVESQRSQEILEETPEVFEFFGPSEVHLESQSSLEPLEQQTPEEDDILLASPSELHQMPKDILDLFG